MLGAVDIPAVQRKAFRAEARGIAHLAHDAGRILPGAGSSKKAWTH
jgi:hypothetical protein